MGRIRMKQVEGLGNVTVETAIEEFLKNCRLRNLSPKTIRYYEEDLQYFARNIPAKNADDIKREVVDDFIFHEMDKGNRITAINTRLRGIRVFIRFCSERDYSEGFSYPLHYAKSTSDIKAVRRNAYSSRIPRRLFTFSKNYDKMNRINSGTDAAFLKKGSKEEKVYVHAL